MLCTFTTEQGTLIVRSDDIRRLEDDGPSTQLVWMEGELRCEQWILGTAAENAARIQQEELDMIGRVEAHRYQVQQQLQAGYPVPPVQRGRK